MPSGYAPFNVQVVGSSVYVSYAKQDADGEEEIAGHNLGFVDKFTDFGQAVQRIASRGNLNAPWGLAIAPPSFGKFAGALLVGNFGDGKIGAYTDSGDFLGFLRDRNNDVLSIDGLWALLPGLPRAEGPMRSGSAPVPMKRRRPRRHHPPRGLADRLRAHPCPDRDAAPRRDVSDGAQRL